MTANDYSATKIMAMVSEKHETEKELNELVSAQNGTQYSCLENPMNRGAWWATAHGFAKSRTRLSN